ncbi:hypothetical protein Tco_0446688 [Tanacetum coccineum]
MIYPISDSPWVIPVHCVPKKGRITVVANEENELIPTHLVTGWRVCIDYRKLNEATLKDHFPLPFMDQMLERLAGNEFYCFLYGFSGYFQIPIDPQDEEKTTFTCPYGTFAYRRMPFGLCNAPWWAAKIYPFRDSHEGTKGSLHLGPERPRVYSDLSHDEKDRYNADIRATNIILQGLPKDIYSLINHYTDAKVPIVGSRNTSLHIFKHESELEMRKRELF